jgi:hypothetical protein
LTSPVYFSTGTACHLSTSQKKGTETKAEASFGIDSKQKDFKCALLYKLQRKHNTKTVNQPNNGIASIVNIATSIHLLVIWDVKDHYHKFCAWLIECTNNFAWDEDKLWALHRIHSGHLDHKSNIAIWLMHDGTVMKTRYDMTYGSDYKLDIFISEETGKYNMERPMKINPDRLVLPLSMLIVLKYMLLVFLFHHHSN